MNSSHEDSSWTLKTIVDRARIRDCLERLARGEDRRDAELIGAAYWPDATDDHGIFIGKFKEYLAWVVPGSPAIPVTLHTLGQSLIDLQGSKALVETHVTSYHRINMGEQERDIVIGGRYLDRMEERHREWRIAHRTMLYDWLKDSGQSVDWSQGVLGMPFLAGNYVGKSTGDYSEIFFTQK
jgi:SnoaL-like domain